MERTGFEHYDERQKFLRYKFGYQAFYLLLILTFLNTYICDMIYAWASPLVANFAVCLLSAYYFGFRTIFSGAYTGDAVSDKRTANLLMPIALVIVIGGVLFILPGLVHGRYHLIEDGKATISFITISCPFALVPFAIAYYAKRTRDQRRNDDKE